MMAVICFIFFLFLDVSMIGLCAYCYSGKENWQEGMILGIHVPREAQQDPQVQALAAKHRKMFRRFQWLNLLAALAFSALCFVSIGIGIFLWSLCRPAKRFTPKRRIWTNLWYVSMGRRILKRSSPII